ncbi:P-loop ATPase, Sll1717 family [Pectobacterium carotovorum]|uniref:P-loop ATPase, Sll1717 family n=1 Tax=Pectobacterium carotovorum TaxID=554 RepID=UPI00301A5BE4
MKLEKISFGERIAEQESEKLSNYFVKTQQWESLYNGDIDIVFGAKGSGKSALYTLLLKRINEFKNKNMVLLSVEKPTGKTVFSDVSDEPPTEEKEFITLWKIYFLQIICDWLINNGHDSGNAKVVIDKLVESGLIEEKNTLKRFVNSAMKFAKQLVNIESIEGGTTVEGGITGKISFKTPSEAERKVGYISVDELFVFLNSYLEEENINFWLLCDRLDVAFEQSLDLEKNALRALFKVYLDLEEFEFISLKIFLRNDIWNRITKEGFREASHITRTTNIEWTLNNLLNLIVIRSLENREIIDELSINPEEIKSDFEKQKEYYYTLFPKQVDIGEKQSDTFDWIISRVRDGLGYVAPRELIHFYNQTVLEERREQDISSNKAEPPNIVSRQAIKKATFEISKVKLEQTLFAEYPLLREYIMTMENQKAEHTLETVAQIWQKDVDVARGIAVQLSEIGFIDQKIFKNDSLLKIPFIYRPYLNIIQGKAF